MCYVHNKRQIRLKTTPQRDEQKESGDRESDEAGVRI